MNGERYQEQRERGHVLSDLLQMQDLVLPQTLQDGLHLYSQRNSAALPRKRRGGQLLELGAEGLHQNLAVNLREVALEKIGLN